jgi:protein CpxP
MKILKFGFIALSMALMSSPIMAQDKNAKMEKVQKSPEQKAKMHTDRMTSELSLNDKQKNKIAKLNLDAVKKNDAIRTNASLTKEQQKSALEANREVHKGQLKQVLTDEQWMKYEGNENARMKKKSDHMEDHKGHDHMKHEKLKQQKSEVEEEVEEL